MLSTEAEKIGGSCGGILSALNADLYTQIDKQMFTALGLASIAQNGQALQWANAAQPHPLIKRNELTFEFGGNGELPLGMMPDITYPNHELELQTGDFVIFYTDGIIEAENQAAEMYGTERLERFVASMDSRMNAGEIIQAILQDVSRFVESAEQYDDMTIVVVKKL